MLIPINITGGGYEHKSRPLTKQVTRNFWPQLQGTKKARSEYILSSFYGLKTFTEFEGNVDRGVVVNQGKLYKVTDTTLYQVIGNGTHSTLGSIPGSNRCIMKAMGSQIIIANGSGAVYVWDGVNLTQNTSINLGNPRGVAVLNNQAIYDAGTGQGFDVSDVGQPSSISGLNNASAESSSDNLLIPYAYRETLYLFGGGTDDGNGTIELWWNSGQGNPPFDKIQGAVINMGLGAIYSVADTPDFIFFLGTDKQFHSLTPGTAAVDTVISTPAMARQISKYLVTSDCIGWTMQLEGQWFYVATFPAEDVTWVMPVGGEWFQWGSGTTGRIRANSYAYVFGKHLVTEHNSGNIYELDDETYTDAGTPIIRSRDSAVIHSGLIGQDNKEFEINSFELILETGVGLPTGQGSNPLVSLAVSRDGGKTFGTERFLRVGELGECVTVHTGSLGRFKASGCVLRITCSDPIYWAIYGANIDMEICV